MDQKEQFWFGLSNYLRENFVDETYQQWIEPARPTRLGPSSITIGVPSAIIKDYWERNLVAYVRLYSLRQYGIEYKPTITITEPVSEQTILPLENPMVNYKKIDKKENNHSKLNPIYTFDTFVVGDGNKLAAGAALATVDNPGITYSPFLIYGGVGLGKTHLMHAIGNELQARHPEFVIQYATSETFMNDYVEAVRDNRMTDFRRKYRQVDVLLIDDIQFLSNKEKTQEEFFHTFNELYENHKQIVMTSDRLPSEIDNLENRLSSRFQWGLTTDIAPPDLETRIAILRKKAGRDDLDIPTECLTYIASHIDSNIRELEGALVRVMAYTTTHGLEFTTATTAKALQSLIDGQTESRVLTPNRIIQTVSKHYGVSIEEIKGHKRKKNIVLPRQVAMYLIRELTELSYPKIASEFGGRNHTTAMHAYDKIHKGLQTDLELEENIRQLKQSLQG